ncbi:glycoside hydrolase family 51 protein [Dothistroma septosporum NZE10]|uniref:non-reducing end alpha-L-arabinofuranosidase n=1 Tax=Dothistroma septosporum (strain NZE10 / CBS 128990) TaxID=675120 RepID=N1Q2S4_DOTSN|nr:glycoside hydrolase family 51 protein [Dothistroma septosporum NZE10]
MTTFTKLAAGEQASISVHADRKLSKINDNIYGGFTEHMGRCVYGGLYDPENTNKSLIDEHGFRKDVIEAMKELNCPVVRYPGGNFVATYHWLDGVGPKEKRPRRPELAWLGVESNQFGTDEFMQWCEAVGNEPYLALNFGTGTLDEALAWLEYCNSSQDTYYANLRRQHGREEPYNVRYWALGNECWGPWQVEQMTKEHYSKKAYQWAKALKLLDPSIALILCGETGHSTWDFYTLKECVRWDQHALGAGNVTASLIDMHSIHIYTACDSDPLKNAVAPRSAERAIEICASLIDLARIENGVPASVPRQTICFDEWNVWDPKRAPGDLGAEEQYTLSDALAVGIWLNVFIRQSKYVGMANLAQSVNVISPLMTTRDGIYKQTIWWPLLLFSKYMRGHTIATHVCCGAYEGETEPKWLQAAADTPWLDVSATLSGDGWVGMAVVNVHQTDAFEVKLDGVNAEGNRVYVYTVTGQEWNLTNTADKQSVGIDESTWDGQGSFKIAKMSMTLLRWKL